MFIEDWIHEGDLGGAAAGLSFCGAGLGIETGVVFILADWFRDGMNISAERVGAQLEVLNEDFRRLAGSRGFNDNPDGADIEIEFCLASVDDQGAELSG